MHDTLFFLKKKLIHRHTHTHKYIKKKNTHTKTQPTQTNKQQQVRIMSTKSEEKRSKDSYYDKHDNYRRHMYDHTHRKRGYGWAWTFIFFFILLSFLFIISSDSDMYHTHIRRYMPEQVTRAVSQINSHHIFTSDEMRIILSADLKHCAIFEDNIYEVVELSEADHQCYNHFQRTGTRSSTEKFTLYYDRGELTYKVDNDVIMLCSASLDQALFP
jgi:hypothetical protein